VFSAYPNPFDRIITFDFTAIHEKVENLSIYNIKGRLIREFISKDIDDSKTMNWTGVDSKGNSISPGIYLYKINTSRFTTLGKIAFVH